jgi:hypothetical protein
MIDRVCTHVFTESKNRAPHFRAGSYAYTIGKYSSSNARHVIIDGSREDFESIRTFAKLARPDTIPHPWRVTVNRGGIP